MTIARIAVASLLFGLSFGYIAGRIARPKPPKPPCSESFHYVDSKRGDFECPANTRIHVPSDGWVKCECSD